MPQKSENAERRAVLLIGNPSPSRDVMSAYLTMMGCRVTSVSATELDFVDGESFDAFLVNCVASELLAEKTILKLCPASSSKIIVIHNRVADPRLLELTDRYHLTQIPEQLWPQQLWPKVEGVIAINDSSIDSPHNVQVAQLIFDSSRLPALLGLRSSHPFARQLIYKHENTTIDILIESSEESGRVWVGGQVMESPAPLARTSGLLVLLVNGTNTLAQVQTTPYGEFSLDFEHRNATALQIRLRDGAWTSIPFEGTDLLRANGAGLQGNDGIGKEPASLHQPALENQAKKQGNGK